jgi:hypothetical protein
VGLTVMEEKPSGPARSGMSQLYFPVLFSVVFHSVLDLGFMPLGGRVALKCSSQFYFSVLFHGVTYLGFISLVDQGWEGQPAPASAGMGCGISSRLQGIGSCPGVRGKGVLDFFWAPGDPGAGLLSFFPCSLPGSGLTGERGDLR